MCGERLAYAVVNRSGQANTYAGSFGLYWFGVWKVATWAAAVHGFFMTGLSGCGLFTTLVMAMHWRTESGGLLLRLRPRDPDPPARRRTRSRGGGGGARAAPGHDWRACGALFAATVVADLVTCRRENNVIRSLRGTFPL